MAPLFIYVTGSRSHQGMLCGLGSGQLSLSDEVALAAPLQTWEEAEAVSQVEEKKVPEQVGQCSLAFQLEVRWVWFADASPVIVLTPKLDLTDTR